MVYNPEIHHRRSIRLKEFDYSSAGAYYITLCSFNRENIFGELENGRVFLNEYGEIAREEWGKTAEIRRGIELDEFVIMPNHMHGILWIEGRGTKHRAPTIEQFGKPTSNTIPTIIRGFKSSVTKRINTKRADFNLPLMTVWQRNYFEHVIRDERDLFNVRQYIQNNPKNWEEDENFPLVKR